MRQIESLRLPSLSTVLIIIATALAALAAGPLVQILRVGVREIAIVIMILLMVILILVPHERVLKFGFILWILTFAFGWRTIYLTPNFNIHPSEVLATLLFLVLLARAIVKRAELDLSLPILIPLFMLFAILGVVTALQRGTALDAVLEEFKPFLAIIPTFYVVKWLVVSRADWERAARLCILVAVYVSCLGLMDYFLPGLSRALSGQQSIETLYASASYQGASFDRVGFIFYGNFSAGFLIFTFLGFTVHYLLNNSGKSKFQLLLVFALGVEFAGIYLSGYRGLWYAVAVFLGVYAAVQRRGWFLAAAVLAALPFLPSDFFNRIQSIFNTEFADSSQYDRILRANYALDLLRQSPLTGVGWAGSGYVHSDLIQIAANLGAPALAIFLLWILGMMWQLLHIAKNPGWVGGFASVILAASCALIIVFAGEGLIVFVQLILPIWFLFAMAYKLIELSQQQHETVSEEYTAVQNLGSVPVTGR